MKTADDLWEEIGSLAEDEMFHVMTKLFALYETEIQQNPHSATAADFFSKLDAAITQTQECNSNRR